MPISIVVASTRVFPSNLRGDLKDFQFFLITDFFAISSSAVHSSFKGDLLA